MIIPHKWPGKKKLMVLCAAMRMLDTGGPKWWDFTDISANGLKKAYPAIRHNMRVVVELHEKTHQRKQRVKDNG